MAKTIIRFAITFVLLVLAQAIVFNHICLFGVAVPLAFIYLIIKLPVTLPVNWALTVGFALGMTIDMFSDTQGMNALACTTLAALRMPVLRLYFPREDEMPDPIPSARSLGSGVFLKYALSMTLIYCLLYFLIDSFSFFNPLRLGLETAGSTILTFIIIVAIDTLTSKSREKRL